MSKRSAQRNRHRNRRKAKTTDNCRIVFGGVDLGTGRNVEIHIPPFRTETKVYHDISEMQLDCLLDTNDFMIAMHRLQENHAFIYGNKPKEKAEAIQVEALPAEEE